MIDGDDELFRRIDGEAVEALALGGDALAEQVDAFELRIGGLRRGDGVAG